MDKKQFTLYEIIMIAILGAIVGYSVYIKNMLLSLFAVVAGVTLLSLAKRKVTEVLEDERIYRISEKASRKTLQIFGISAALIGVIMISSKEFAQAGFALSFAAIALIILYLIFYGYYNKRGLE